MRRSGEKFHVFWSRTSQVAKFRRERGVKAYPNSTKIRTLTRTSARLAWITDPHFDRMSDQRFSGEIHRLSNIRCDSYLITGDLSIAGRINDHLARLSKVLAPRPVFFVTGNHDYFGSSFAEVDAGLNEVCHRHANLIQLGYGEIIRLSATTCLIGHRGWCDGLAGDGVETSVWSSDQSKISDFRGLDHDQFFDAMEAKGRDSAIYLRSILPAALSRYQTVLIASHFPPFPDGVIHEGRRAGDAWLPFYTNQSVGRLIAGIALNHPRKRIIVCAGHTHRPITTNILRNLELRVGAKLSARSGGVALLSIN